MKPWLNYIEVDGVPVPEPDIVAFGRWFETAKRHVADETVDGIRISTVFLGIDHNFYGEGPPLLYETMLFGAEGGEQMWRYSTRAEAAEGHQAAVEMIKRGEVKRSSP